MADSLILASSIELLGGGDGIPSELPNCLGAVFTLDPGFDLGAPQPTTDEVSSLVLDGERPYGTRSSDRTVTLPITVGAPSRDLLAGALETLLQLIDAQTWTLTWTRDGGLPLVLDCFRAEPSRPVYDLIGAQQFSASITITFQALPFGRSDQATQVTFASPLAGTTAPPAPAHLDNFATVTGAQWVQSTQFITGPHSAKWDPSISPAHNSTGAGLPAVYAASVTPVDISALRYFAFNAGFGSAYYYYVGLGPVTFSITLTDGAGRTLSFGTTQSCNTSQSTSAPSWTAITVPIPQGASFDYTTLSAYQIRMTNSSGGGGFGFGFGGGGSGPGLTYVDAYLDAISVTASSSGTVASTRGAVYSVLVSGTSHAPMSMQFSQATPTTPFSTLVVHRPGPDSPASLQPFMPVGNGADAPNGTIHYPVPSLIAGVNAVFGGTYSILLVASSFNSPSTSHTVTVVFTQYEYSGGPSVTSPPVARVFVPNNDARNGMINLGSITLPVKDIAPDNTGALFDATVLSSNTSDRMLDLILVDNQGQTAWVNTTGSYTLYYLDEPSTDRDLGRLLGTSSTRGRAVSVMGDTSISGGPPTVDPGANTLLCYAKEGAPALTAFLFERFFLDRIG